MSNTATAAVPAIGHNNPPAPTIEDLHKELIELPEILANHGINTKERIKKLLEDAAAIPATFTEAAHAEGCTDVIAAIQGLQRKIEAERTRVKAPFLLANTTIEKFFKGMDTELGAARIKAKAPLKAWDDKIAAELAAKAEADAREARRIAQEKADEAAAAAEKARLEQEAAEQKKRDAQALIDKAAQDLLDAKTAEDKKKAAADLELAAKEVKTADKAIVKADKDMEKAENKLDTAGRYESTANKLEGMTASGRGMGAMTMGNSGASSSHTYTWQVEIVDYDAIDLNSLRDVLDRDAVQKALNARKNAYVTELKTNKDAPVPVIKGAVIKQVKDLRVRG